MTTPRPSVLSSYGRRVRWSIIASGIVALVTVALTSQLGWSQQASKQIKLETRDGVKLVCQYYPSPKGESAVPIVLLHEWKGKGSELLTLATFLNGATAGRHAVLVPDLRGHGSSTTRVGPDGAELRGQLDAAKMRKPDFEKMVTQDLEAIKRFLISEHNQRKLNVDMLCVVGTEMGALAGLYWTVHDWKWPTLSGGRRQGQDVKALIMISPPVGFKGVSANPALADDAIRRRLAIQILYGKNGKPAAAARRMHSALDRDQGDVAGYDLRSFDTSLQGTALFTERQLNVSGFIASFIKKHVVDEQESMPWKPREASDADAATPKPASSR